MDEPLLLDRPSLSFDGWLPILTVWLALAVYAQVRQIRMWWCLRRGAVVTDTVMCLMVVETASPGRLGSALGLTA